MLVILQLFCYPIEEMYRSSWCHNLIKAIWPETSASFVHFYDHMFEQPQMATDGFHGAGITETVN